MYGDVWGILYNTKSQRNLHCGFCGFLVKRQAVFFYLRVWEGTSAPTKIQAGEFFNANNENTKYMLICYADMLSGSSSTHTVTVLLPALADIA